MRCIDGLLLDSTKYRFGCHEYRNEKREQDVSLQNMRIKITKYRTKYFS